jgi:phosphoribosylamine--glycine ligase
VRILVVGGGGREHALVRSLQRSSRAAEVVCCPGNPGIAEDARCFELEGSARALALGVAGGDAEDLRSVVARAVEEEIDLAVIGPEVPLVAGLADALEEAGVPAFGPSAAAARIEASKLYAKRVMADAGVPTASHAVLPGRDEALEQLSRAAYPTVLKADGLAGGKGVLICATEAEAREAVEAFFVERRFGDTEVLLEEHLTGEELSLLALCDGDNVLPLAPAQDYKRIGDGDTGPNTGGMGSYSPVPGFDRETVEEITELVHRPVVTALRDAGIPYHGVLYAGLMLTVDGPRLVEYNVRFGDPEAQAVLPLLRSDLAALALAAVDGDVTAVPLDVLDGASCTVVAAAAGYPAAPRLGDPVTGMFDVDRSNALVFPAGLRDGLTAGGRVLAVTAVAESFANARARAYRAVDAIDFADGFHRRDIGWRELERAS